MTTRTADKGEGDDPRPAGAGRPGRWSRPGRRQAQGRSSRAVRADQPPLTICTPDIVPCAVWSAELTDEVPVMAAWIAVQMACDTFG